MRLWVTWCQAVVVALTCIPIERDAAGQEPRLRGRVVDADKRPVVGAKVTAVALINSSIFFSNSDDVSANSEQVGDTTEVDQSRGYILTAETSENGIFEVGNTAGGEYGIVVSHKKKGVAVRICQISSRQDQMEISLQEPTRFVGQIRNLKLDPQKNYVNLECESTYPWLNISVRLNVGDDGRFDTGPLPPLGKWSIVVWEWNIANAFNTALYKAPVDLKFGETNTASVDLDRGGNLRGVVTGPERKPIANAAVIVRSKARDGEERGAITDTEGRFEIRGIANGNYQLNVDRWKLRQTPGCGPGPRDVHMESDLQFKEGIEPLKLVVEKYVPSVEVGDLAPDFVASTLDRKEFRLKEVRGKVVLLDFWATWCGMCQSAVPKLKELHKEFEKAGLVIVGVSVDKDSHRAESFVLRNSITWDQTALGSIEANPIARMYNVNSTPTIILIGRDGKVAARDIAESELREAIHLALTGKPGGQERKNRSGGP